jgi:Fic family protein
VQEVCNYLDTVKYARKQLRSPKGLPLSLRLLHEAHRRLMRGVRGANKQPGEVRRSQNWIGGTRPDNAAFVPAPPEEVPALLSDLEKYLHADNGLPSLVRIGLIHVQFETIHPYLDGNGRIGRLLITLLLCHDEVLREPLLYSSLYFKQNRQQYYSALNAVRESGDFERWIEFFATGIRVSAEQATTTGQRIFAVFQEDRNRLRRLGRHAPTALLVQEALQAKPLATIAVLTKSTQLTTPTVTQGLRQLEELGIVRETTGRARGRIYAYVRYLEALNAESDRRARAKKTAPARRRRRQK